MEYKLTVLGKTGAGKSSLVIQLIQNHFIEDYDPQLEDSYRKRVVIDDQACLLDILDSTETGEFSAMRDQYMRTSQGFLLVYSVTSQPSFEAIAEFREQVLRVKDADAVPMCLCATKADLEGERTVATEEGRALAQRWQIPFHETSAKNRVNVSEAFFDVVRQINGANHPTVK